MTAIPVKCEDLLGLGNLEQYSNSVLRFNAMRDIEDQNFKFNVAMAFGMAALQSA